MKQLLEADVHRWYGRFSYWLLFKGVLSIRGLRFVFFMRLTKYFNSVPLLKYVFLVWFRIIKLIYSTDINFRADVGPGLRLHHIFCTTWGKDVVIGRNVTIVHNVTIAGKNGQFPVIGNNVYLGSGCCVLGGITIGDHAVIGANAVVTKDVPPHSVVVGCPSKIISQAGSKELIVNPWEGDA